MYHFDVSQIHTINIDVENLFINNVMNILKYVK